MKFGKLMRNRLAPAIFFGVLLLAAAGAAYLAIGAGANVNCIAGTCYSTNGFWNDTSPYDSTTDPDGTGPKGPPFTGDNDTASIECAGNGSATFKGGGGNDTFYIHNPQTATAKAVTIEGEDGDDVILDACIPTSGTNTLKGGPGNDFIAEDAAGKLYGGAGNDLLAGGDGADYLDGGDGNDVIIGGPGNDTFSSSDNGDDIYIIHKGDVNSGGTESYTCVGNDTILLFGFDRDGVIEVPPTASPYTLTDPNTGGTYTFAATAPDKCTLIFVD
jgi:Ca2+-binding RTX toxin-like protein